MPSYTDFGKSTSLQYKNEGVVSGFAEVLYVAEQNSASGTTFRFTALGKKKNSLAK